MCFSLSSCILNIQIASLQTPPPKKKRGKLFAICQIWSSFGSVRVFQPKGGGGIQLLCLSLALIYWWSSCEPRLDLTPLKGNNGLFGFRWWVGKSFWGPRLQNRQFDWWAPGFPLLSKVILRSFLPGLSSWSLQLLKVNQMVSKTTWLPNTTIDFICQKPAWGGCEWWPRDPGTLQWSYILNHCQVLERGSREPVDSATVLSVRSSSFW